MDYETLWKEVQKVDPCGVASIASELAMHPMNICYERWEYHAIV